MVTAATSARSGPRGDTGHGSAGPRVRVLDHEEVLARQAHWKAQPGGPERTRALTTIRSQLRCIDRRVEAQS